MNKFNKIILFIFFLSIISKNVLADPPLGPSRSVQQAGTTIVSNAHVDNYVSGCTVAKNGSTANITCAGTGVPTTRAINTTSPLTGGGTLAADLTLACPTCLTGSPSAIGDVMYSTSGGQAFTALADVAAGAFLRSGGVAAAPVYSTTTWPNAATTGDIIYATGTNALGRLADVATNQVLLSGGVGALPSYGTVPNAALTNSSVTVNTSSPLGGGGAVNLGASLTLTCSTCLIDGTNLLTGAVILQNSSGGLGGNLFAIENNAATVNYFAVPDNSTIAVKPNASTTTTQFQINSQQTATANTAVFDVENNGVDRVFVDGVGNIRVNVAGNGAGLVNGTNNSSLFPINGAIGIYNANFQPNTDSNIIYTIGTATKRWARAYFAGTALVAGDFALSGAWGSTATVSAITATDDGGVFTVNATGTGQSSNPTITLTFHDGTWTNAPNCTSKLESSNDGSNSVRAAFPTETTNATTDVITLNTAAPIGTSTVFIFRFMCIGM